MARLLTACAWLLIPVVTGPPALHARPSRAADEAWVEARSRRFVVYSDAGEREAVSAARFLERLADVLQMTTSGLGIDSGRPVRVYLFRDLDSLDVHGGGGRHQEGRTLGFTVGAPDLDLVAYGPSPDEDQRSAAAHEYLHALLHRSVEGVPLWLDEGLAEFYSTFRARGRSADVGRLVRAHVGWIQAGSLLPVDELLAFKAGDYPTGKAHYMAYAESWALVHMLLLNDGRDGARFSRLLGAYHRGVPGRIAMLQVYGPGSGDSLQRMLPTYVSRSELPYSRWDFKEDFSEVPVTTRAVPPREMRIALGELAGHGGTERRHSRARGFLESAWREDSTVADAAALLADLARRTGRHDEAKSWLAAADRAPEGSPRAHALVGGMQVWQPLREGYSPSHPARGVDPVTRRARGHLAVALQAEPGNVTWLRDYGLTFLEDSVDVTPGLSALRAVNEAVPDRPETVGALGFLQARSGDFGSALSSYRSLSGGMPAKAWRSWLGGLLGRMAFDEVRAKVERGQAVDAESLLVRLERMVPEPAVVRAAQDMRRVLASGAGGSKSPPPGE